MTSPIPAAAVEAAAKAIWIENDCWRVKVGRQDKSWPWSDTDEETKQRFRDSATACLTEAGQWLTESSAPDPKPASGLSARSLHDLRNPNPNPRER